MRLIRLLMVLLGAGIFAGLPIQSAYATARGDFFDLSKKPTVQFEKKSFTWVLRNQAVERVLHYDAKKGALETTQLRDIKHNWFLPSLAGFEGSLAFASPIIGSPAPLNGWKVTRTAPSQNWAKTDFDDSGWNPAAVPISSNAANKPLWLRVTLPADSMTDTRKYALMFDRAIRGEAEIFLDGASAQKFTTADHPENRLLELDITSAVHTVGIKLTGVDAPPALTGSVSLAQIGSSPPNIELNSDWKYVLHSVNTNEDGSQILTISLSGVNRYEGFDLDVYYQIYPGDEPFLVKWFTFTSHRSTRFLLDEVTFDRVGLPAENARVQAFPGTGLAASDLATENGLLTAVLSVAGSTEQSSDGKQIELVSRPGYALKPNTPQDTPRALLCLYHGPIATGAFLYQLYAGQYLARATPTSVPTLYNTWYGYQDSISAETCEKIIPLAAALGVKIFVIDHGWETNSTPDSGPFGDWITDRSKFPKGLFPISLLARANGMRFGLWTLPITVGEKSQVVVDHDSWLLRQPGNQPVPEGSKTVGMCFTSGWADNYIASFRDLCRELTVSYLKVDGNLYYDFCTDPAHDHPVGHALTTQIENWTKFCEEMRKVNPDFIINRSNERGPEAIGMQDEGIFGDWEIGGDAKRMADSAWWYKNADLYRRTLYDLTWTRPPFTIEFETPCHIPTPTGDLNALEYHFTSVGAYVSNVEIHGKLEEMTPDEQATIKKWIKWNEENRPWLAYAQPLSTLGQPWNPKDAASKPHVDGVLHLRNALNGRYGYVCLWNPGESADHPTISFRPADYFVKMSSGIEIIRLKDDKPVRFTNLNGVISLDDLPMAPRSWEIYEIRQVKRK